MGEYDMYKVDAPTGQLLKEFYQLMISLDAVGDIKEQLMNEDELEAWAELTVLEGALRERLAATEQPATPTTDAGELVRVSHALEHEAHENITLKMELAEALGLHRHEFLDADGGEAVIEAIEAMRAQLVKAETALRSCINADLTDYWSAEEVAKRYFAEQQALVKPDAGA